MQWFKIFTITGSILLILGIILEAFYFFYLKDLVWILLIYPPPGTAIWQKVVPILGLAFMGLGVGSLFTGLWLYLKSDLEKIRKLQNI